MSISTYLKFIFLLTFSSFTYSVLVKVDTLFNKGQTLTLLSESHEPHLSDQEQLKQCTETLIQRDNRMQHLHVLIEKPTTLTSFFGQQPKVTTHLESELTTKLQRTTFENVEIRCISNAALYLLQAGINQKTICPGIRYDSAQKTCQIGAITFNDLTTELLQQQGQVKYTEDLLPKTPDAQNTWNELMNEIQKNYHQLTQIIGENNLQKSLILEQSNRFSTEKLKKLRETLFNAISAASVPLLDAHIVNRIFCLSPIPNITLIAGFYHIRSITSILRNCGFQFGSSYGAIPSGITPIAPLELNRLGLFNPRPKTKCIIL